MCRLRVVDRIVTFLIQQHVVQACEHAIRLQQLLALCLDGSLDASNAFAFGDFAITRSRRRSEETRVGSELRSGGTFDVSSLPAMATPRCGCGQACGGVSSTVVRRYRSNAPWVESLRQK